MHKITNFTGQARHGWEKMTPSMSFGMSRPHNEAQMPMTSAPVKRSLASSSLSPGPSAGTTINVSFNVPFASNLAGPEADDIIHASPGAFGRWTHPDGTVEGTPNYKLPVHVNNVEVLRSLCRQISESSNGALQATVTSAEPKPIPGVPRGPLKTLITNVCLYGEFELVNKCRARILNDTPISLVSTETSRVQKNHHSTDLLHSGVRPLTSTTISLLIPTRKVSGLSFSNTWTTLPTGPRPMSFFSTRDRSMSSRRASMATWTPLTNLGFGLLCMGTWRARNTPRLTF